VIEFSRGADGRLAFVQSFSTSGTGTSEPALMPTGVLDTDKAIIVNSAHTRLFAVNQGSDTITVFNIASNGSLSQVVGSPFSSGGQAPVSLALSNNDTTLTVVNNDLDPGRGLTGAAPNYVSFTVSSSGALTPVSNSTIALTAGSAPSIALPVSGGSLILGANFLGDQIPVLHVGSNGQLTQAPGSPHIPESSIFTGAAAGKPHHPFGVGVLPSLTQRIVYVSYPLAQELAVYSYDSTGELSFSRAVPNTGKAACWITINNAGTRLYTSNAVSGDLSVFDIGTDPTNPNQIQLFPLTSITGSSNLNGNPWHLSLDPANQFLYVLTPRDLASTPAGQGNTIHVLQLNSDGTLTEVPNSTVTINVPVGTNPQGMAVL